jgi:hypothetical protein
MAEEKTGAPAVPATSTTDATPGQDSTLLTGQKPSAEGTPPLAAGATPKPPPAWVAQLEGDLQKNEVLTQHETISKLSRAYVDLVGKQASRVTVPGKDATAEEVAAYRKAIGVPEKPGDYKLDAVKLPKEVPIDAKFQTDFLETAHKLGMTNEQTNYLFQWYALSVVKQVSQQLRAVETSDKQAEQQLRARWGGNFDRNLAYMQRAIKPYLEKYPDLTPALNRSGLGNHVGLLEMLAELGSLQGEHRFVDGRTTPTPMGEIGKRTDAELAEVLYPSAKKAAGE